MDRALMDLFKARAVAEGLWQPKRVDRRAMLLEQGELCDSVFILTQGLVKLTYMSAEGDEWIKSFITDAGLFGTSGGEATPSRFGAQAIEASVVTELPGDWVRRVASDDRAVANAVARFNSWLAERKQVREETLLCLSVEDRYRVLSAENPQLVARLPQGDIARYLRVTPIAFSRIKRRVQSTAR